jgi:hypothetical protein
MESLIEGVNSLELSIICVPFNPTGENASSIKANFSSTPRYLFHVFDSKTRSKTDDKWVRSFDAVNDEWDYMNDLFKRPNAGDVARELNEHLRWSSPTTSGKDNLVSWTNSLPFAIAYAIYRNKFPGLKTPLDHICLCVVDTSRLPAGAFIKDMDLMGEYRDALPCDEKIRIFIRGQWKPDVPWSQYGLPNLISFREENGRLSGFKGYNYFGEYLSQGKLNVERACTIVSFSKIINPSLYTLYSPFEALMKGNRANWVKPVMEHRESYGENPKPLTLAEVQAVIAITDNFEPQWRLAIAANLFALRLRREDDQVLLGAFRNHFNGKHTPGRL